MANAPLVFERSYNASIEKVWHAITDRDAMEKWYFKLADFKTEIGFQFEFEGGPDSGNLYLHRCIITEIIPNKKIVYSWEYVGYNGKSYVTFELFPEGEKTKLILTHAGLESFPQENKDFAASNFNEGWTYLIGTTLKEYLENN